MTATMGVVLMIVGVWLFAQVAMGGLVDRIRTYTGEDRDYSGGPQGSVATLPPKKAGKGGIRIAAGVKRGDPVVLDVIAPACAAVGGGWILTSWHRPGAVTSSGRPSCHRHGKGTGKGAGDLVPDDSDWNRADRLVAQLRSTLGVGEVIFRGDKAHDPALGAKGPHVHVGVNCG